MISFVCFDGVDDVVGCVTCIAVSAWPPIKKVTTLQRDSARRVSVETDEAMEASLLGGGDDASDGSGKRRSSSTSFGLEKSQT